MTDWENNMLRRDESFKAFPYVAFGYTKMTWLFNVCLSTFCLHKRLSISGPFSYTTAKNRCMEIQPQGIAAKN